MPNRIILGRDGAPATQFQADHGQRLSTIGAVEEADRSSSWQHQARAADALRHEAQAVRKTLAAHCALGRTGARLAN